MYHQAYEIIRSNPGITENELREKLGIPVPLFDNEDCCDELSGVLADCQDNGLYLYQEGDCLWICE